MKRLVTSAVIGARDFGYSEGQVFASAMAAASAYRRGLQEMMQLGLAERYYRRVDTTVIRAQLDTPGQVVLDQALAQARKRTSTQFVRKMTVLGDDGKRMFVEDPPVLTRIAASDREDLERLFRSYLRTVPADIALLLSQHELTDAARRVVGVGSVGTRCSVVLLTGPHHNPMVLQVKEALPSVLDTYGGARSRVLPDGAVSIPTRRAAHDGQRVVDNQRILQAVSDLFLGHLRFGGRDHYVRQFRDMKGSIDVELLGSKQFATYAAGCGTVLARAHSQSPECADDCRLPREWAAFRPSGSRVVARVCRPVPRRLPPVRRGTLPDTVDTVIGVKSRYLLALPLILLLAGCAPAAVTPTPTPTQTAVAISPACDTAMSAAADVPFDQSAAEALGATLTACTSLDEWSAALQKYPAVGAVPEITDQEIPLYLKIVCDQAPNAGADNDICKEGVARGLLTT